jgi:hypothetical protein
MLPGAVVTLIKFKGQVRQSLTLELTPQRASRQLTHTATVLDIKVRISPSGATG